MREYQRELREKRKSDNEKKIKTEQNWNLLSSLQGNSSTNGYNYISTSPARDICIMLLTQGPRLSKNLRPNMPPKRGLLHQRNQKNR